jgi:hypothetical protein
MIFDPSLHVGERVTIHGRAEDARAGAIVSLADDTPIYVAGLAGWDEDTSGKPIEVSGIVRRRESRIPHVPPGSEQYHGLGESYVLEDPSWTLAKR